MAIVGGNLERKEIGLPIGLSGTHKNTEIDSVTGLLRLKEVDTDGSGKHIYADNGTWISDVIDLEDRFADFDKVFTTDINNGSSSIAVLTRVSDDSMNWSEWKAVALDGSIQSDTKQYIQVRIDLFAGYDTDIYLISEFDDVDDVSLFDNNKFVETSNGLRLKREYNYDMTLDTSWTGEGSLHRKKVSRDEWLRIDRLQVVRK